MHLWQAFDRALRPPLWDFSASFLWISKLPVRSATGTDGRRYKACLSIPHTLTCSPGCVMMWLPLLVMADFSFSSCCLLCFFALVCLFLFLSNICAFGVFSLCVLKLLRACPSELLWNDRHGHGQPWIYCSVVFFDWDVPVTVLTLQGTINQYSVRDYFYNVQGKMKKFHDPNTNYTAENVRLLTRFHSTPRDTF